MLNSVYLPIPKDRIKMEDRNLLKCLGAGVDRPSFFSISKVNTFLSKKEYSVVGSRILKGLWMSRNLFWKMQQTSRLVMKIDIDWDSLDLTFQNYLWVSVRVTSIWFFYFFFNSSFLKAMEKAQYERSFSSETGKKYSKCLWYFLLDSFF